MTETSGMKIRIKGNSLRIRVSRKEVSKLAEEAYLEEQTCFGENKLIYALQSDDKKEELSAQFSGNKIVMSVPATFVKEWPINTVVGLDANMPLKDNEQLYLLLEKDFICLDTTTEDQSDNYENPSKQC